MDAGLRRQLLFPGVLNVVKDPGNELRLAIVAGRCARRGTAHRFRGRDGAAGEEREQVRVEDEAQHQQHKRAADADVHTAESAESESATAAAAFATTVFHVVTDAAWCPLHRRNASTSRTKAGD